jgi:hypothetical protein
MSIDKLPFNIFLLSNDRSEIVGQLPVRSLDIFSSDNQFNVDGLYSSVTFGEVGTYDRQSRCGYIDLRTEVMHPKIFKELVKLKGLYGGIIAGRIYAVWDDKVKDFVPSNVIDGKTGYSFFMTHFLEMMHATNDSNIRDLRIKLMEKSKDKCMYQYYQVIPAALRDIEMNSQERPKEDEINQMYRKMIRASNTISIHNRNHNDPMLDTARWTLQQAANDVYEYLQSIMAGKHGWLMDKVASRNVSGGTRNVITAMDAAPKKLGAKDAITVDHTLVGLHQYLKGTIDLTIYDIRKGPMAPVLEFMPTMAYVVDVKTLNRKSITPSRFTVDNWGTEEGIEKLINGFAKDTTRHKPIMIDGSYAALVYKDNKHVKVFYDISELPHGFDKSKVSPLTWAEAFYLSVYRSAEDVGNYDTRYPVADLGSIYGAKTYLVTTVKADSLIELDEHWTPMLGEVHLFSYPIKSEPFVDSCSIHPNKENGAGADHDGDFYYTLKCA